MQPIKSNAVSTVLALLSPQVSVIGYEVRNKWLVAILDSGVRLWVPNK